jgi:hypothetical protein
VEKLLKAASSEAKEEKPKIEIEVPKAAKDHPIKRE